MAPGKTGRRRSSRRTAAKEKPLECPCGAGPFKSERGLAQHRARAKVHQGDKLRPKRKTAQRCTPLEPDPRRRWRPSSKTGPVCGYTHDGKTCGERGAHYCEPRADKVVDFFALLLVHIKGPYVRRAFVLEPWQEQDIVRPLFGEVIWSEHWGCYVRRYTEAVIVLGRKNGKSELAAGIALYLLCADDEESAEVYSAADDTKQARKVWEPAERMRALSQILGNPKVTGVNKNEKRIYYPRLASFYEIITADAEGELGHNPHGFILDEFLTQRDGSIWEALVSAAGARLQALFVAISTETNKPGSWGAKKIDEAERVQEDPARAPRTFAYCRTSPRTTEQLEQLHRSWPGHPDLPVSLDWTDEGNWYWPNPALGSFLNIETLRDLASKAAQDPEKENSFRQLRLNQRVSQVTRWIPMDIWRAPSNFQMVDEDELGGRPCFGGLDLSATTDLTAWCLLFPPVDGEDFWQAIWRYWTPEDLVPFLDRHTGGQLSGWVKQGWIYATEGDVIDYEGDDDGLSNGRLAVHPMIAADARRFRIKSVGFDRAMAAPTVQHMQRLGLHVAAAPQGFGLSTALKELLRRIKADEFRHGGNPVTTWNADSAEVKRNPTTEAIQLVKPEREKSGARVDGIAAAANAVLAEMTFDETRRAPATATGTDGPVATDSLYRPTGRLRL